MLHASVCLGVHVKCKTTAVEFFVVEVAWVQENVM